MAPIYLIGFMGAGKTTVGEGLSTVLGCPVRDTDLLIEQDEKMKVSEIFALYGEKYFRNKEKIVLKKTKTYNGIVTTGGGIITSEENQKLLIHYGTTVFLKCEPETIISRITNDDTRPLTVNKTPQDLIELYKKRLPLYVKSADIIIDSSNMTVEETVNEIVQSIKGGKTGYTEGE